MTGAKVLCRIRKNQIFRQAFVNQSLSRQIVRVATPKCGYFWNVSTRTNKKGPVLLPGPFYSVNPQGFQHVLILTVLRPAW
jgi:hypothetical protein